MTGDVEGYILGLADGDRPWISTATAASAVAALRALRASVPGLPEPQAAPGPDGLVGLNWTTGGRHVSLEVRADGVHEAFVENLRTGGTWSDEGATTPPGLADRLALAVRIEAARPRIAEPLGRGLGQGDLYRALCSVAEALKAEGWGRREAYAAFLDVFCERVVVDGETVVPQAVEDAFAEVLDAVSGWCGGGGVWGAVAEDPDP